MRPSVCLSDHMLQTDDITDGEDVPGIQPSILAKENVIAERVIMENKNFIFYERKTSEQ